MRTVVLPLLFLLPMLAAAYPAPATAERPAPTALDRLAPATRQPAPAAAPGTGRPAARADDVAGMNADRPPPFGANLFTGAFQAERTDGLNADYVVAPGDRIALRLWGEAEVDRILAVDAQGNVFIPGVGPVEVAGVRAADLDGRIRGKVRSVYTNNVEVYVTILTATPVGVFVTGPVLRPGEYAGLPSDSLLSFLQRAGGIDPGRGSYRGVRVLRGGRTVLRTDLYRFLRYGEVPALRFEDGDVVLVGEQGPTVTVEGDAKGAFRFELTAPQATGAELVEMARPLAGASHAAVSGTRPGGPFSVYLPVADFAGFTLQDGDRVRFATDARDEVINVRIEGSYLGPSLYAVRRDATLREVLDHVAVDPNASQYEAVYLRRRSVARAQRDTLDESLRRLEQSVLTAPAGSDGEATIRVKEAELVNAFVERARTVEPEGRVVVSRDGHLSDIRLEDGDTIVIPQRSDLVLLGGEVLVPQAVVHRPGMRAREYVLDAGGYTERADAERILIFHPNGEVTIGPDGEVLPGDRLMVMPKVDTKGMQFAKDVVQIIYQVAVSAAVALSL